LNSSSDSSMIFKVSTTENICRVAAPLLWNGWSGI